MNKTNKACIDKRKQIINNKQISEQRQFWDTRYPQENIHNVQKY